MLAKDNNDVPFLQSNKAIDKALEIGQRIIRTTPSLAKELSPDSIFKLHNQAFPDLNATNTVQMPIIKRPENNRDPKKKGPNATGAQNFTSTTNTFNNSFKAGLSVVEWQNKYFELEEEYKMLKEDYRVLQYEKEQKEARICKSSVRYVKREEGYRKIIDELHEELRKDFSLGGNERKKMEEIVNLHTKVMDNIENIQLKTSKVLLDQEKDIIRFFNNKINEIKKQFEDERIKRNKKDQNYEVKEKQLIAELEWVKDIAQKIDQENHSLMKKYMDLKAQYSTQENDREILLREVILKKKKNAILKTQIEQYEKVLEEVSKDNQNSSVLNKTIDKSMMNKTSYMREKNGFGLDNSHNLSAKRRSGLFSAEKNNERAQTAASNNQRFIRTENIINKLKNALQKEKKRVQQIKTLYIKELESKSALEKVLKACIEDIKNDIFAAQKDKNYTSNRKLSVQNDAALNKNERAELVEKLIHDERILTLIYDKTFYANNKKIEIPPELLKDDEDEDIEGIFP